MKRPKALEIFIIPITYFYVFTSCTKEIDIDVNTSHPQIVVEANLDNQNPISVKLTESVNFDDDNSFPVVQGATIVISDNLGNSEILSEISPGNYVGSSVVGSLNHVYTLNVLGNEKELNSTCTIPNKVSFDSLVVNTVTEGTGGGFGGGQGGGGSSHEVIVEYLDPADESNFYRFVEYKNNQFVNAFIYDDRLSNGIKNVNTLQSFNRTLSSGDTIMIEMQCISKDIYEYYKSFGNLFGGPTNASTPANPYSNVEGTQLGYFSAHTSEVKIYVTP